ncbi:MAG: PD-(D/E)XK nuclease family protein [Muribaculaceae bacterium]|nr:PD-(D/E)XK nuclease family protein [Muribaculaceae bacterium]
MIPILECIAKAYSDKYGDLSGYCFVFPNKRSMKFFKHYIGEKSETGNAGLITMTINDFIARLSGRQEASRIKQLLLLFLCFKEIITEKDLQGAEEIDFDSFRTWGETVLSDFNTVDQNLVEPEEIFKNVKDFRAISTNFLTEEQREVKRDYFGREDYSDPTRFWNNFDIEDEKMSEGKARFINLWQILLPLYRKFTTRLASEKLASNGGMYRAAYERLTEKGIKLVKYKKIVVIGFNALNAAERAIFSELGRMKPYSGDEGMIDFVWDATGPVLTKGNNSASKFVDYNKKEFPMPDWLQEELRKCENSSWPELKLINSPSNTAQIKIAGEILQDIYKGKDHTRELTDTDTVLVLPDESLLANVLFSLPEEIKDVNLTMGLSFKNTSVASFFNLIRRNYSHSRVGQGETTFFTADLKILLSHPFAYLLFGNAAIDRLISYLNRYHKITVTTTEIKKLIDDNTMLFEFPDKKSKGSDMFRYVEDVLSLLTNALGIKIESVNKHAFYLSQIRVYGKKLESLREVLAEYEVDVSPSGVLQQIDHLVSKEIIGFEGEPTHGLQIMGALETRLLDFKNVVVVSMNEGSMPKRSRQKSFIPEIIRKEFGMPPAHYSEEIFAYYFFRLISRAERVFLIYDGRATNGFKGGESRYLLQLRKLAGKANIKEEERSFILKNTETKEFEIIKDKDINQRLRAYTASDDSRKNFSSSSLNTYRECQMKFYLQYVMDINPDPEKGEFIDSITIGDVLHTVMMELYMPEKLQHKLLSEPVIIEKKDIENYLQNEEYLLSLIHKIIKEIYYGTGKDGGNVELSNSSTLIADNILEMVKQILRYDMKLTPLNVYGCEISKNIKITLESGREVNFRFAIDRLDSIDREGEKLYRIIDYKTGLLKLKAESIEEVIRGDYTSEQIFQLFTYAWLLNKLEFKPGARLITEIYGVPYIEKNKAGKPEIGKQKIESYNEYAEEFSSGIESLIDEIFDSPSFNPKENGEECGYCAFKSICGR